MIKSLLLIITLTVISTASIDFDINKISADANRTNKHIMIFFHKDYCGYCNKMEENIESNNISKIIKKEFLLLSINRDDDEIVTYQNFKGSNHKFAKALGIDFYPTLIFVDGNGRIVYDVIGYREENQISNILKYITKKSYKNMTLEEFKDELLFDE
ncbi:thioredoxin fold domain-containing protein [Sulfurovum sp. bin170]|uniref:thioredoxin family protein n=1 Tax=Sulfurovum sp. bin170 TaxID=2695268 RepID=UPI0013E04D39|nr:thioredoxin fold domain-containing protein [Sulfurovum sp. bin170]NEW61509.1 thioredoxin fold domain-containing protein [Sulfurovum sp. bin170]